METSIYAVVTLILFTLAVILVMLGLLYED